MREVPLLQLCSQHPYGENIRRSPVKASPGRQGNISLFRDLSHDKWTGDLFVVFLGCTLFSFYGPSSRSRFALFLHERCLVCTVFYCSRATSRSFMFTSVPFFFGLGFPYLFSTGLSSRSPFTALEPFSQFSSWWKNFHLLDPALPFI